MSAPTQPRFSSSLSTPRIETNPWIILLVLTLGFFMILLDTTIVNVALPSIIDSLHASLDQVLWVLNAYVLVYAVLLITAGRLGDMFGPRRLFMTGLTLFVLASAACGLSQTPNQLIFFRVVQGIGGAILTPQSLAMIPAIFPAERRGAAFGVWGAVAGLAAIAGPTLGGFLTTDFSWRAIFYVNLPIGIIALLLAFFVLPELTIHHKHRLDLPGIALVSSGLFLGIFGLIEGERYAWGPISTWGAFSIGLLHASVWSIPTSIAAGIVLLIAFVVVEAHQEEPLLPLTLFRDRNFSASNLVSVVITFAMFGFFLPMTLFLQSDLGLDALHAGFVFVPMSLVSTVIAPFAGRLTDRINERWLLGFGLSVFAVGMGLVIVTASLSATGLSFTPALILAGIGMGCTFAPLTTAAMRNIEPGLSGAASGFLNTTRQVGGAIGSAVIGAVLQNRLAGDLHDQAVRYAAQIHFPASFPAAAAAKVRAGFIDGFSHASQSGFQVGRGQTGAKLPGGSNLPQGIAVQLQTLGHEVFRHAFLLALKPSLAISIVGLSIGALTAILFIRNTTAGGVKQEQRRPGLAAAGE